MAITIKTAAYAVEISEEIATLRAHIARLDDPKACRLELIGRGNGMTVGCPLNVHLDAETKADVLNIINRKLASAERRLRELGFTL